MRQIELNRWKLVLPLIVASILVLITLAISNFVYTPVANYNLTIDNYPPEFHFSNSKSVPEFHVINFTELKADNSFNETSWSIHPAGSDDQIYEISNLVYGKVPHGWVELAPAKPLKLNTMYEIDGSHYFRSPRFGFYEIFSQVNFDTVTKKH